jgi:hypothetical protein
MSRTHEQIVSAEVHYCVSFLVSTLAAGYGAIEMPRRLRDAPTIGDLADLTEQAAELASPTDDWEEAAHQAGWRVFDHPGEGVGLRNDKLDRDWPEIDWEAAARDAGEEEPYQREVFEHWIVSDWLADELAQRGEKVDTDFAGMTVWARTTTGQGIASDSVIEQIAADMAKRYGGTI